VSTSGPPKEAWRNCWCCFVREADKGSWESLSEEVPNSQSKTKTSFGVARRRAPCG